MLIPFFTTVVKLPRQPRESRSAFHYVQQPSSLVHRRLLADSCVKLKTVSKPTR